jgi:hypothetical protein
MYCLTLECRFVERRMKIFARKLLIGIYVIRGEEVAVGWRQLEKLTS